MPTLGLDITFQPTLQVGVEVEVPAGGVAVADAVAVRLGVRLGGKAVIVEVGVAVEIVVAQGSE